MGYWGYSFQPYVSVAQRRANAMRKVNQLRKKGRTITPVECGKKIAESFWGKAWCENLECYSDYENRLPRGKTYVRNGSVVDLQIAPGKVTALVSGSELYEVEIVIKPLPGKTWKCIRGACAGQIGSLVELLQGRLSQQVMQVVTKQRTGLFPSPSEIDMDCSCPDAAGMCKHIAAVMYGVGARLDRQPELLFLLRKVDHLDLIASAADAPAIAAPPGEESIAESDLSAIFGVELDVAPPPPPPPPGSKTKRTPARKKSKGKS
jgi:uncharacterized Zn finger protein